MVFCGKKYIPFIPDKSLRLASGVLRLVVSLLPECIYMMVSTQQHTCYHTLIQEILRDNLGRYYAND